MHQESDFFVVPEPHTPQTIDGRVRDAQGMCIGGYLRYEVNQIAK